MMLRVGIGGFGAIGQAVATAIDAGMEGFELTAVSAGNRSRAEARQANFRAPAPVVLPD